MVDNAVLKYLLNTSDGGEDPFITTYITPIPVLPNEKMNMTIDVASLLGGLLYPFSASFLIPVSQQSK